jgi:UDP-glucose 4-epimerase
MVARKRVLVTGVGGELGTRVASLLEELPWVEDVIGVDIDPPRGRLRRTTFQRIDPRDRRRTVELVSSADAHVVLHLGVYEPNARATPLSAAARSEAGAVSVLGAAAEGRSLEAIVVRSGIEVYGRRRGATARPDEAVHPDPTSAFGRTLALVEGLAEGAGRAADVPVTLLRMAPVLGPHVPSPLGRYLRLPAVPVELLADPPLTLLHVEDAAAAVVAAARAGVAGPVNVVAEGAVTPLQAVRMGNRLPLLVLGPPWWLARAAAGLLGAPVPEHLIELLSRGRVADGGRAAALLGTSPHWSTQAVVKELYRWASVTQLRRPVEAVA